MKRALLLLLCACGSGLEPNEDAGQANDAGPSGPCDCADLGQVTAGAQCTTVCTTARLSVNLSVCRALTHCTDCCEWRAEDAGR